MAGEAADYTVRKAAFMASFETKKQLDALFLEENVPLGRLLNGLLGTASRVSAELQAA